MASWIGNITGKGGSPGGGGGGSGTNAPPVIQSAVTATPAVTWVWGSVAFSVIASDPDGDTLYYIWDFGDGWHGIGANASHVYLVEGTYTATVKVYDRHNSPVSSSVNVTVYKLGSLGVVNQKLTLNFTRPNNDSFSASFYNTDFGLGSLTSYAGRTLDIWVKGRQLDSIPLGSSKGGGTIAGGKMAWTTRNSAIKYVCSRANLQTLFGNCGALSAPV